MPHDLWSSRVDLSPWDTDFTAAFELFWQHHVDPDTGVVYDAPMQPGMVDADCVIGRFIHRTPPAAIPAGYAHPEFGPWPTPEEVAASIPTLNGWDTAIENSPSLGGPLLAGLAAGAFNLSHSRRRACMDQLFHGLISLWRVPGETGFVCRGYLPKSKAFYRQTSYDQVPYLVYGLSRYARSGYCSARQRDEAIACVQSVLVRMEQAAWHLANHDETPSPPKRPFRLDDPGHFAKLMAMLLQGWELTGDPHWREVYERHLADDAARTTRALDRQDKVWEPYMLFFLAVALKELARLDGRDDRKTWFDERRRLIMPKLASFCGRHVYAQFQPTLPKHQGTIHARGDRLIDFRPALAQSAAEHGFLPDDVTFRWLYREALERERARQGTSDDGWLLYDFFCVTGAHQLVMSDWPSGRPHWGAERTRRAIEGFFTRLSFKHPSRFLPKLSLAIAPGLAT